MTVSATSGFFAPSGLTALAAAVLLLPALGVATTPANDARPPCVRALIEMTSDVDTARARAGDSFGIRTVDAVTGADGTVVPAGTAGFGVVAIAHHAERGGRGGYVVLETRFLALASGVHVPVTIDWASAERATATGSSQNIPGIVGAVPLVGYVLGPYGFLHHGKDVTIARETRIRVLVGDDVAAGACRVATPGPAASATIPGATDSPTSATPAPASSSAPSVSAAPSASPMPPASAASSLPSGLPRA
jgi:hypothetical protein